MEIITVGLPVYNAELFIKDTIQSILNQTYHNFKLLIVDDGSTDKSIDIINSFNDKRIEVIIDNKNLGLPYRLNQIAQLTKTKYLARMDADDIMHPDRISRQLSVLENNHNIDVLGTNVLSIDENNIIQGIRFKQLDNELIACKHFVHPTIMAKTTWFLSNPYDLKALRVEDTELWQRTHKLFNFKMIMQPLLFYREFGSSYYKKYFLGFPSMMYLVKKEKSFSKIVLAVKYFITGIVYFVFNIFDKEKILIKKRNYMIMETSEYKEILESAIKLSNK